MTNVRTLTSANRWTAFLDTSRVRTRFNERVAAPDGTELSVDLYLPPERGRYPVLLTRTPADNNRGWSRDRAPAEQWRAFAARGFIVAAADVRGRGDSAGRFTPFVDEAEDGAATVAWARQLDESDGRVGLFGSGYGAFCAWAAAVADGHVDAIASLSPFGAVGEGLVQRGGALRLDWLFWMHLIGGRTVQPPDLPPWPQIHRHLPVSTMNDALGRADIWWRDWLDHLDPRDSYWNPLDLADRIATLRTPGLHVTGWWDGNAGGARYFYDAARRSQAPQRLIVGPWSTAAVRRPVREVGGFDFGPRSVLDLDEILLRFFAEALGGSEIRPATTYFVTGRNEWTDAVAPQPEPSESLRLHLRSHGRANTRRGDGELSPSPATDDNADTIDDNPDVPVEFQPEFRSFANGFGPSDFALDQSHITRRDEALVYTSAPLPAPIAVQGQPTVRLSVRTAAPDADLYVLLSDVFPLGGRDLHLGHGALRLATLDRFSPGQDVEVELRLDAVAHEFLPAHQIRVTIVPSLFPLYARNLHAGNYTEAATPAFAEIQLAHGPRTPSFLDLPLAVTADDIAAHENRRKK